MNILDTIRDHTQINQRYDMAKPTEDAFAAILQELLADVGAVVEVNRPEERYSKTDVRIHQAGATIKVELESSTDHIWTTKTPPPSWSTLNILGRKAHGDWDVFIKYNQHSGYKCFWAISKHGFDKASKEFIYENDCIHYADDHTKVKLPLSIVNDREFTGLVAFDDYAKLKDLILRELSLATHYMRNLPQKKHNFC